MIIAALVVFAVLLVAWLVAPAEPTLTVVEPMDRPLEQPAMAEAA